MQINTSESRQKIIFIVLAVLIIIGAGVLWYINFSGSSPPVSVVSGGNAPTENATNNTNNATVNDEKANEILNAIEVIKSINLNTSFFDEQRFRQLRETPFEIKEITLPENYRYKFRLGASVVAPTPVPTPTPVRGR
jgi:hypothetical protein